MYQKIENTKTEENKFNWYATHTIYDDHKPESSYYEQIEKIFLNRINEHHYIKALIRIKINLYPKTEKLHYHNPHKDYPFKHKGCILSLNDCDGFTIIGKKKIPSIANQTFKWLEKNQYHLNS